MKSIVKVIACSLCIAVLVAATASADDRVQATQKGSFLIYPKVELRWDAAGDLIQDTVITLVNDYPAAVNVQMYFVQGDPEILPDGMERYHPGWMWVDNRIVLTANQPIYWSAYTGSSLLSPFTILDPGMPEGRPALDGTGDRVLRGFIIAWAVNANGEEIRWNHLSGGATLVHYQTGSAWQYNAYAFQTAYDGVSHGAVLGTPGELYFDGMEYDYCYSDLLMEFFSVGATALSGAGKIVTADTDLTIVPMDIDVRQETGGPVTTKIKFDIWNQNETKFSNTERCITGWDQELLSNYAFPNHFLIGNLHTDNGKARLNGMASEVVCGPLSVDSAILGVVMTLLDFDAGTDFGRAGSNLVGMGEEEALVQLDVDDQPIPEKLNVAPTRTSGVSVRGISAGSRALAIEEIPAE